jgi:hypothetical protein
MIADLGVKASFKPATTSLLGCGERGRSPGPDPAYIDTYLVHSRGAVVYGAGGISLYCPTEQGTGVSR